MGEKGPEISNNQEHSPGLHLHVCPCMRVCKLPSLRLQLKPALAQQTHIQALSCTSESMDVCHVCPPSCIPMWSGMDEPVQDQSV